MGKIFGIDLGTTNSCLAFMSEDGLVRIPKIVETNQSTLPSVVYFENETNIVVGEDAKKLTLLEPEKVVECVKSHIGDENWRFYVNNKDYSAIEISSMILKKIKNNAEHQLNCEVKDVVITCPAYFKDYERNATKQAGIIAGLNVLAIINEPTAACCSYVLGTEEKVNKKVLVYDLGGGTFDCTFMKIDTTSDKKTIDVLASKGDPSLGGKNWDQCVIEYALRYIADTIGYSVDDLRQETDLIMEISNAAEEAKKKITNLEKYDIGLRYDGKRIQIPFNREIFDAMTKTLLDRTMTFVEHLLKEVAEMKNEDNNFEEILLVGGSSKMPQVTNRLKAAFPDKNIRIYDPDESVANGAAIFAKLISTFTESSTASKSSSNSQYSGGGSSYTSNSNESSTKGSLGGEKSLSMTETINSSYGIKTVDDHEKYYISNILQKNSKIDVEHGLKKTKTFTTFGDNSISVQIAIYENDSPSEEIPLPDSMKPIHEYEFQFSKPRPKGSPIEVTLFIDPSGILHLEAIDKVDNQVCKSSMNSKILSIEQVEELKTKNNNIRVN